MSHTMTDYVTQEAAEEKTPSSERLARWLFPFLITIAGVALTLLLLTIVSEQPEEPKRQLLLIDAISLFVILVLMYVARRGHVRGAAIALLVLLYLGCALPSLLFFRSIRAPNIVGLFVLVPLAAILLGRRATFVVTVLGIGTVVVVYLAEHILGPMQNLATTADFANLFMITVGLALNAAMLLSAMRYADENAARALRSAGRLASVNSDLVTSQAELETIKRELEVRVVERTAELDEANRKLHAEVEVRVQSELRFRRLAEHSPDLIYILALPSRRWTYANRDFLLDHPLRSISTPDALAQWVHPDDLPVLTARWQRADVDGDALNDFEFRLRRTTGEWEWLHSRATVLEQTPDGVLVQVLQTVSVVTQRKVYVAELETARRNAEIAAHAKSDFLANMSHEIRTPLNAVIGMASLLDMTDLTAEQREFVRTIHGSSEALLSIIGDILDFSRLESPAFNLELGECDPELLISQIADMVSVEINRKGLELICAIDARVPSRIIADEHRLRQLLINLTGNAVKFTEKGEIAIRMDAVPLEGDDLELNVTIRDTGIGIPWDKQQVIFEQFAQADASHTRRFGGTGLGLAISRRLALLMDGDIDVESEPGVGSQFRCRVRVRRAGSGSTRHVSMRPARMRGNGVVIYPNATQRAVLVEFLTQAGLTVRTAATLADAETWPTGAWPIHMMLLDAGELAGIDQPALARLAANTRLCVIAPPHERELRTRLAGFPAATIMAKPVTPRALRRCLTPTEESQQAGAPPARAVAQERGRDRIKILVVEDNQINQKVLLRILERSGYVADTVANGADGVAAVRNGAYDVVFMDVQMPEMDGLQATRAIRLLPDTVKQPYIVALTAAVTEVDRTHCMEAGMDDFVAKPAQIQDITDALGRAVGAQT